MKIFQKHPILAAILLGFIALLLLAATNVIQVTVHRPYNLLRAEASEDTAITAGSFSAKPATAVKMQARDSGESNYLGITGIGGDAANDNFSWRLYAWRAGNGPAELVAHGTGILGSQAVGTYPANVGTNEAGVSPKGTATSKFWIDSFVVTAEYWLNTLNVSTVGGDSVAAIGFDTFGYEWFYFEITNADGSASEAELMTIYYSFF